MKETARNAGLLFLRVMGGAGIAIHGYHKVFGGQMADFAKMAIEPMGFPFPLVFAYLSGLTEFLGGIFIAVGLATRLAAFPLFFNMCVAVFMVHMRNKDPLGKMEPALAYLTAVGAILLTGSGAFSLDRIIFGKKK